MVIFEKVIMSDTEPTNTNVLWLRVDEDNKGLWGFGSKGWSKICDFNEGDNPVIKEILEKIQVLEEGTLSWEEE